MIGVRGLAFGMYAAWAVLLAATISGAQPDSRSPEDAFDRARQDQNAAFDEFTEQLESEWRAWARADSLAFAQFRTEVEAIWGEYRGSTKKDWVEYADDLASRTEVDFETGVATVEVVIPEVTDATERGERLRSAVANLVRDRGKTMDYPVLDQDPQPLGDSPILHDQLARADGSVVTPDEADAYAREVISTHQVVTEPAVPHAEDVAPERGSRVARIKLSVTIPLVPNHLRVRAERYVEAVRRFANRYGLDMRVVMAIIHTESYFNPKARSSAPAFGLMQLVPSTGGRDAYELVTGIAANPSLNELYNPERNIELGCAYLSLIKDRYLSGIQDLQSRIYCTICAYNTGAGNVSRAFTGDNRVRVATARINEMQPERVLATLKRKLPAEETRRYIEDVLERARLYDEWKN